MQAKTIDRKPDRGQVFHVSQKGVFKHDKKRVFGVPKTRLTGHHSARVRARYVGEVDKNRIIGTK